MSRIIRIVIILFLLLVTGTVAFRFIEGHQQEATWLNCAYMAVTTLSTVGYGEIIPLSPGGRLFVMGYLIVGFSFVSYGVFTVGQWLVTNELQGLLEKRRMEQKIHHLSGHYLVCGCGRMGRTICRQLHERGKPFVVIDKNEQLLQQECRPLGWKYLVGDATDDAMLERAGIQHARALAAVLPTDADNVYVVLSARLINKDLQIIARASDDKATGKLHQAGANRVVSPFSTGAAKMARFMISPNIEDFLEIADQNGREFELADVQITAESPYLGKSLRETDLRELGIIVLGIRRANGERLMPPSGAAVIEVGDCLFAFGSSEAMNRMLPDRGLL